MRGGLEDMILDTIGSRSLKSGRLFMNDQHNTITARYLTIEYSGSIFSSLQRTT